MRVPLLAMAGMLLAAGYAEPAVAGQAADPFTRTGIDVLVETEYAPLSGRRIGLITNQTGIDRHGVSTARRLYDAPDVELVALFSPEHGLEGRLDIPNIDHGQDRATGLPVYSLYGESRSPTPTMLEGIDTLVFDIQDIGTRFYTYVSTMGLAMRAAERQGVRFMVLDRPNPINGVDVGGPVADDDRLSFTAFHPLPTRHGMTAGELARMFADELALDLDLEVVEMRQWSRGDYYESTGLRWVNPSPNMRNLEQAILYPGIGLLETTNLSVGRGTDTPFQVIGAPWLDGDAFARELNRLGIAGVAFLPVRFTPSASRFAGESCGGFHALVIDRATFDPVRAGFEIALLLRRRYPDTWDAAAYGRLLANGRVHDLVLEGRDWSGLAAVIDRERERFVRRRAKYLIYP